MANEKTDKTKSEKEALKKNFRLIKSESPKSPAIGKKKLLRFPLFPNLPPAT